MIPQHPCIIIVGSGQSAKGFVPPKDIPVIAVNGAIDWIERADYWFTLDHSPANIHRMIYKREGTRYFAAVPSGFLHLPSGVTKLERISGKSFNKNRAQLGLNTSDLCINTGNSAWGALGLAYHMGAKRVMMIGVDGDSNPRCEGGNSYDLSHLPELFASAKGQINLISCGNLAGYEKVELQDAYRWLRRGAVKRIDHKVNIVCVYKTGGDVYTLEYVKRLMDSLEHYKSENVKLFCISDDHRVSRFCNYIPLNKPEWIGWWSKLNLFSTFKAKDETTVYFDLDTVIRDDISELLAHKHNFTMLSDFYKPEFPASGVLAWTGDYSYLADGFRNEYDSKYRATGKWGDQGWISDRLELLGVEPDRFDKLFPKLINSYKLNYTAENAVICFHGDPRPHTVGWIV